MCRLDGFSHKFVFFLGVLLGSTVLNTRDLVPIIESGLAYVRGYRWDAQRECVILESKYDVSIYSNTNVFFLFYCHNAISTQ